MLFRSRHGTIVSYDLNYRPSLWKSIGGQKKAREVNREIAKHVDVMIGCDELDVLGITAKGQAVPVIEGGTWVLG